MDKIEIVGGKPLTGAINISGAKNAALPIMAASLLTNKRLTISNIPFLSDIESMIKLLQSLNVRIKRSGNSLSLISSKPNSLSASYDLVRKMRASFLILGPLIARYGKASVSLPGGCAIGTRPVNLHIEGLRQMGVNFEIENGYVSGKINGSLRGAEIKLEKVSVGATENLILAATLARGKTIIKNAAREPEISDLCNMLIKMGAEINGVGTKKIIIKGKKKLEGCTYKIMPDRIESGTFVLCVFGCTGTVLLKNLNMEVCNHLIKIFKKLKSLELKILKEGRNLLVKRLNDKKIFLSIKTKEYPGFPTDLQAQLTSALLKTKGKSEIEENIFENRFMHVSELIRMGAKLRQKGSKVIINGTDRLNGAEVMATDLRASSSLVIAGLMAHGKTIINRVYHLDRGYENIEKKLKQCGANINRLKK